MQRTKSLRRRGKVSGRPKTALSSRFASLSMSVANLRASRRYDYPCERRRLHDTFPAILRYLPYVFHKERVDGPEVSIVAAGGAEHGFLGTIVPVHHDSASPFSKIWRSISWISPLRRPLRVSIAAFICLVTSDLTHPGSLSLWDLGTITHMLTDKSSQGAGRGVGACDWSSAPTTKPRVAPSRKGETVIGINRGPPRRHDSPSTSPQRPSNAACNRPYRFSAW